MSYFDRKQLFTRLPKILNLCFILALLGCQSNFSPALTPTVSTGSTGSTGSSGSGDTTSTQTGPQIPASYFGLTVHQSSLVPVVPYNTVRSWDAVPGPDWADSNPAPGVYKFASLDAFIAANQATGSTPGRDMIYTLGRTPQWASSQPNAPTDYGPGQCAPPSDITNWDNYVTAVATHANGAIKYWEIWNEPMNAKYYCGDIPTMVTLAQHARTIIKNIDPDAVILSPATGSGWGPAWLSSFLLQGGASTVDVIAFHGYWSQTAEDIVTVIGDYKTLMAQNGLSNLPIWDTEASGEAMPTMDQDAAFLSKYYLLHASLGVARFLWYGYDSSLQWGQLWTAAGGPNEAGTAYAQTYDWMVGATLTSPCAMGTNGVWSCGFSRTNYEAMALWNSTAPTTVSVLSQFVQYRDLMGVVHPITDGTVPVGNSPILVETPATQSASLAFASIATQAFGGAPFPVYASSPSNGAITYSVVSGPATLSGSMITLTGAGTVVLQASQAASANYVAATANTSFIVTPIAPTLAFASIAPETFGSAPFPVSASSPSNSPITYSVVSGPASISGSTVTLTGGGTVTLAASQAASGGYTAGSVTTSFTVGVATPVLSFAPINPPTFGDAPIQLSATSASNGAVSYSLISGAASISGSTLTIKGAGTVWVLASQAATTSYAAATAKTSFVVAPTTPTLSFVAIPSQIFGNTAYARLTSNSNGAVTYSVISGPATVSANAITTTGVGTVWLSASQAALGNYIAGTATTSFIVTPRTPTLSFVSIPAETYGGSSFQVSATSASNGPVSYSVLSGPATVSGSTVTLTGAGWVRLSATQAASGNYATATTSTTFQAVGATPSLAFAAIGTQNYGSLPFQVSATSPSTGGITYTVGSGPATISGSTVTLTGTGTVVLNASQLARGNYGPATATTSFNVTSGPAALSFAKIAKQTNGNPPFTVSATSASTGSVRYAVVSGPAVISGSTVTLTGGGTVTLSATQAAAGGYSTGSATTSFTVGAGTPAISIAAIPAATFGDAPARLSTTSTSDGAITYSVVAGGASISGSTVTATAAGTITVKASQAATANYAATSTTTSFTVAPTAPTLSLVAIPSQIFGNTAYARVTTNAHGALTYSVVSGPAIVSGNAITFTGTGTVVLQATQAALGNYTQGTATTSFTVTPRTPVLSFAALPGTIYAGSPLQVSATSASGAPVTYTVLLGHATVSGSTVTPTTAGWVKIGATQAAGGNYTSATTGISFYVTAN